MTDKILCVAFYWFAKFLRLTYRFRYFGVENFEAAKSFRSNHTFCLASWHEHALAGVLGQVGYPYCFLISNSRDGKFVDYLSSKFGFATARGSSSKGGKEARENLERKMTEGYAAAFTVDGPRGPRHKAKPGVLHIALKMNTVILPVTAIAKDPVVFYKSWDKSKLPKPFSKIVYQFGPIIDAKALEMEYGFEGALEKINEALIKNEEFANNNLVTYEKGLKIKFRGETSSSR